MKDSDYWQNKSFTRAILPGLNLAVRGGKICPGQETGSGNRGRLRVLNDTKLVPNEHE